MPILEISLKKLDVSENGSVEKERAAAFSAVLFFPAQERLELPPRHELLSAHFRSKY